MAGLSITGQMKVSTLQERFSKEFGLTLRIYDGRSFADKEITIGQIRKQKGSGKLSIKKNMKVGTLEEKIEEEFGIKVQIAGSDDSYLCDNDLTLASAQEKDEKKIGKRTKVLETNDENNFGDQLEAAEVNDNSNDESHNAITLTFKNFGGEFQYHRLNKQEALYLKKEYEKDRDTFLDTNLQGGESFDETIWPGSYGPSINGLELINDLTNKKIDLSQTQKKKCFFTDGESDMKPGCLDYFYITEGKIFGSITINLADGKSFDPKNLIITYIEYSLDGYPEKYGTIIHKIQYDGKTCDIESEDNGVDIYRYLIAYDIDEEGDCEENFIVYASIDKTDWAWDLCDKIFK